jgi:hypothetical protein
MKPCPLGLWRCGGGPPRSGAAVWFCRSRACAFLNEGECRGRAACLWRQGVYWWRGCRGARPAAGGPALNAACLWWRAHKKTRPLLTGEPQTPRHLPVEESRHTQSQVPPRWASSSPLQFGGHLRMALGLLVTRMTAPVNRAVRLFSEFH